MRHVRLRSLRHSFTFAWIASATACFAPTAAEDPLPGPRLDSAVFADSNHDRSMTTSVLLPVSPEEAAAWITDPARLRVWFAEEVEFGAAGGEFHFGWPSAQQEWRGKLLELDPAGRLVAEVPSRLDGSPVQLRFAATAEAGFQRVSVTIGPFGKEMADEAVAIGYREGTAAALLQLQRAASGEATAPPALPVVKREFQARETPREGLEAEIKMKNAPKTPAPKEGPEGSK